MPLPGGPADKYGNRYEDLWTVGCLADVMDERADAIRLEPPGDEGDGIEFWLSVEGNYQYHQVKRQNGSEGRWTLSELNINGVLENYWNRLQEPSAQCVFVSTDGVQFLRELADDARNAESVQEFERVFLKSGTRRKALARLCHYWGNCSVENAYQALQRIEVHTVDEDKLRADVIRRLEYLVVADDAEILLARLIQFVHQNIHQTLIGHDIWRFVESQPGYQRRRLERDPRLLGAVANATDKYVGSLRKTLIAGELIQREEAQQILEILRQPDQSYNVLISGEAGAGKSHVILQVIEALRAEGWPVLALGLDLGVPARLPEEVGEKLFQRRLSPVDVLAGVAHGRPCLLALDQIDLLSRFSGQYTQSYDCLDAIIEQAQKSPQMRVLLACRRFHLESDDRLQRLKRQTDQLQVVSVGHLPQTTVRDLVARLGLDPARLSDKQLSLLSIPLHLYLLDGIAQGATANALDFKTANDLYDRYWTYKQALIRARRGTPPKDWTDIIDVLTQYMSDQQRLSAPEHLLDRYADDAVAMTSEHVLLLEHKRYSFFHEEFFDYAFARRFVGAERQLAAFLLEGDQQLFRRTQVRHILTYQRSLGKPEQAKYLGNLRDLLAAPGIHFHLKQIALVLLKTVDNPEKEEWQILEPIVEGEDEALITEVVKALDGSVSWFTLLDQLGVIQRWLAEDRFAQKALILLTGIQRILPDRVAELVEPFVDTDTWRVRFSYLMNFSEIGASRRFLTLFLRLIDAGALDEARAALAANGDFWLMVYGLPEEHPDWACEVIGHYFNRKLAISAASDQKNPFDRDSGTLFSTVGGEGYLLRAAKGAAAAFAEHVLPFMLDVMELTADKSEPTPWKDSVWAYRYFGPVHGLDHEILSAMEIALSTLASEAPDLFRTYTDRLKDVEFETAQYLLVRGYAGNGAYFADEAIEYICERPARLATGYLNDTFGATRQLLETVTPHCSTGHLLQLEQLLLTYYPEYERDARGYRHQGRAQWELLEGIAPNRRSPAVRRRLEELQRKFHGKAEGVQVTISTGWVGSPIPETAAEKMSDAQWLLAVARYDHDDMDTAREDLFIGGASQLALMLHRQVKRDPVRFAKLICQFPDGIKSVYFNHALAGLWEVGISTDLLVSVAKRCHDLPEHPCGRELCRLIAKNSDVLLPPELLDIVVWYATEDTDPEQELWRTPAPGGGVYYGGNVLTAGINSVRGSAAEAIADLIATDGTRIEYLNKALDHLARDPSLAVRSCAASAVHAVFLHDQERGIELFQHLCEAEDDLLNTPYIEHFLHKAVRTHFAFVEQVIQRMIASSSFAVASAGARVACYATLLIEEAQPLVQECLVRTPSHRFGAAQIFAAKLRDPGCRASCEEILARLANDPDTVVREEVAKCFYEFTGPDLIAYASFIETFVHSEAFSTNPFPLIHVLTQADISMPELICLICERFLDVTGNDLNDIRKHAAGYTHLVGQLIAQAYKQNADAALRMRCLAVIDRMSRAGVHDINGLLENYER